jgi:perosamine synthetase
MSRGKKYWFDETGFNYRMTNVQAALGCAQMERIEQFVAKKRHNAQLYDRLLAPDFVRAKEQAGGFHSYWMLSVLVPERISRDQFAVRLRERGVDTRPFFYPLTDMPPYRSCRFELSREAQQVAANGITLPSSTRLTDADIQTVCDVANQALRE